MTEKLTIGQLIKRTRNEQSAYLAILQDMGVDRAPRKLVKAKTDRKVKELVDNLNKNAPK
jgi:hypothetical protein